MTGAGSKQLSFHPTSSSCKRDIHKISSSNTAAITDSGGHWNIKFPPRPDGSIKTYYENGTNVSEKDGKIIKRFTE